MSKIIYYELCEDGYIEEDGKEIFSKCIKQFKTKDELITYAKKKKLNPDNHYIDSIGEEIIEGFKLPCTINDFPEYLNQILKTTNK